MNAFTAAGAMTQLSPAHLAQGPAPLHRRQAMWIHPERLVYVGLVGQPSPRTLGSYTLYLSLDRPHRLLMDGTEHTAWLSVVPPYACHQLSSDRGTICALLIEPESVDLGHALAFMRMCDQAEDVPDALRRSVDCFIESPGYGFGDTQKFDNFFFGQCLAERKVDPRIHHVLRAVQDRPEGQISAADCAARIHLSVSRFLHLFKSEIGISFRHYRAWKRARSILRCVTQQANMVDIALDAGYPDSSHFSHSMRRYYGLSPRSIFMGSRKLTLLDGAAATV
ncbi:AraC family transcriptional regulator [Pseudoxanthomonas sp.]|uniref:helix-turn-helix transcriptional regulator n=1 Tax=Pseudoxanthomonas sp. TaxID=1871049 RepID=UPI002609BD49|nr:AraC family transcriptional regulator [Pseudoxanthomonas sp.]WDS36928.1 MAG: AraC family transcriptional regulator [Pseudoxanthomonas sp.]